MKGSVEATIYGIAALLIVLVLIIFAASGASKIFLDKRGETELAAMGIRNAIVQISLTENSLATYVVPGNEKYTVEVDETSVHVQYAGDTLPGMKPKITMSHYTSELRQPATLTGPVFCIVKKKDPDNACKPFVEICVEGDACCRTVFDKSVC